MNKQEITLDYPNVSLFQLVLENKSRTLSRPESHLAKVHIGGCIKSDRGTNDSSRERSAPTLLEVSETKSQWIPGDKKQVQIAFNTNSGVIELLWASLRPSLMVILW